MTAQPMRVSFNPKRDLPYMGALAQAIQFSHASSVLFGPEGWFFGGVMGVLVSVSVAYATSQYADIAQKRKPFAMAALIILALFSPVIVGTGAYLKLTPITDPIWRGVVAFAWGVLPDASVAIVGFIAGKGLVKADAEQPIAKPKPEKPAIELEKPAFKCPHPGCDVTKPTQAALNAHQAKHKAKVVGYHVTMEPVTESKNER